MNTKNKRKKIVFSKAGVIFSIILFIGIYLYFYFQDTTKKILDVLIYSIFIWAFFGGIEAIYYSFKKE